MIMNKQLIINADDFGLTRAVNYGILDAFLNHDISAASLMVNTPATMHAVELIKKYQLPVGIHINITLGKPLSSKELVDTLVDKNGCFHKNGYYLDGNHVDEKQLILEFDRQIEEFVHLIGHLPDHINYHHIYDFYQEYPGLFSHLVRQYHLPMRLEKDFDNYPFQYFSKQDLFMDQDGQMDPYLQETYVELPCHIGYIDDDLIQISSLNIARCHDALLAHSQQFKKMYQQQGYQLVSWKDVKFKGQL